MDADHLAEACESEDRDGIRDQIAAQARPGEQVALAGRRSYDSLSPRAQAVVRARWSVQMTDRISALDMRAVLSSPEQPAVELDDDGEVVHRQLG